MSGPDISFPLGLIIWSTCEGSIANLLCRIHKAKYDDDEKKDQDRETKKSRSKSRTRSRTRSLFGGKRPATSGT